MSTDTTITDERLQAMIEKTAKRAVVHDEDCSGKATLGSD